MIKTTLLFIATALAEIIGCFLPYVWLRKGGAAWLLLPAAASLALFVWLLSLHPVASGRVYAAYGGIYVTTALVWLRVVDGYLLLTGLAQVLHCSVWRLSSPDGARRMPALIPIFPAGKIRIPR